MNTAVRAFLIAIAMASPAAAQSVKDYVEVEGARSNYLRGYGLVTGLNGNGDSPKGESARMLFNMIKNMQSPETLVQEINARNVALVMINAEMPPFQKKGTKIDVQVSAIGDAKSLSGGMLQLTDLRGPGGRNDPKIYAFAQGKLIVQGDQRTGNLTTGSVPNGAILEAELKHEFVFDTTYKIGNRTVRGKAIKLVLQKSDLTMASQIAKQINVEAVRTRNKNNEVVWIEVARALDGGSIEVRIPTVEDYIELYEAKEPVEIERARKEYPNFDREPVKWLDKVLNISIQLASSEEAVIVIIDATKSVAVSRTVMVKRGSITLNQQGGGVATIKVNDEMPLHDWLMDPIVQGALRGTTLIDAIKAMYEAKMIKGKLISR